VGQVSINIRGRQYQIACDDGQEAHLARLGRYLDQRAEQAAPPAGSVSESLLLVMVALLVADELADTTAEIDALKNVADNAGQLQNARDTAERDVVKALDGVAERIERIAARLEGS
jgi:cell division protein ZapA